MSCSDDVTNGGSKGYADPQPLKGIRARIINGTDKTSRATNSVPLLIDSIGRTSFGSNDEMTFTTIKRTEQSIADFTYHGVGYTFMLPTEPEEGNTSGLVSGYWKEDNASLDVYWSDAMSPHTFIGYSLPHSTTKKATGEGGDGYDWTPNENGYYYGSIGKVDEATEVIDYNAGEDVRYTSENLRKEDLLLAYDTELVADESVAEVLFYHALASMRIAVTISGFSTTGSDDDSKAKVTNVIVKDQPVMYRWGQRTHSVEALTSADANVVSSWNMKKHMKLWQPNPNGEGSGSGRRFNFYGITVPGDQSHIEIQFNVTYPNPMKPVDNQTKKYTAILDAGKLGSDVKFQAGMCTSITINLSHKDEHITIGAEYFPWHPIDSPDDGNLFKKSTFLSSAGYATVTYSGDNPTKDDATWLYHEAVDGVDVVKDIYGNDGSSTESPYTVTCAQEFLSFAKEVNNGNDFTGKFIRLDANLYMQATTNGTNVAWPGIGDAEHAFNGTFLGEQRSIKRLNGKPLFVNIGASGRVDGLWLEDVLGVTSGSGALAETNNGIITACKVESQLDKILIINKTASSQVNYAGAICGENKGMIVGCYAQGLFSVYAKTVGGLVGKNDENGRIVASYSALQYYDVGAIKEDGFDGTGKTGPTTIGGIVGEGTCNYCLYCNELTTSSRGDSDPATGMTATAMQKDSFVGGTADTNTETTTLNGAIHKWCLNDTWSSFDKNAIFSPAITDGNGNVVTPAVTLAEHINRINFVSRVASFPILGEPQ